MKIDPGLRTTVVSFDVGVEAFYRPTGYSRFLVMSLMTATTVAFWIIKRPWSVVV